jgi:hypothetical protein
MQSFNEIVMEFNTYIQQQKFLEALDKFYHADVISAVNDNAPVVGINSLRNEVKLFMEDTQIHVIELVSLVMEKNLSVTNWYYSMEHKQIGVMDHHQFSVHRWKDNKIIQEHHLYVL